MGMKTEVEFSVKVTITDGQVSQQDMTAIESMVETIRRMNNAGVLPIERVTETESVIRQLPIPQSLRRPVYQAPGPPYCAQDWPADRVLPDGFTRCELRCGRIHVDTAKGRAGHVRFCRVRRGTARPVVAAS